MSPRPGRRSEGRPLARAAVSLSSGAQVQDALAAARPRGRRDRRRRRTWSSGCSRGGAGGRVRRAARARRRGRDRPGAARGARDPLHGLGPAACIRAPTRCWPSTRCASAGIPTPAFLTFNETVVRELGAGQALPAIEARPRLPARRQARHTGGSALGIKFARTAAGAAGRAGRAPSPTTARSCSSATSGAATSPSRSSTTATGARPRALPVVEAVPREEDFYDFESRYEIGRTTLRVPGRARRRDHAARAGDRARGLRAARLPGFARVDLMLDAASGELWVLEVNVVPGHDRDEPAAPGRRRGGHRLRRAGRADPRRGARPARSRRRRSPPA